MIIRMRLRAGAAIPGRLSTHPLCPRSPGTRAQRAVHNPAAEAHPTSTRRSDDQKPCSGRNLDRESPPIIHGAPKVPRVISVLPVSRDVISPDRQDRQSPEHVCAGGLRECPPVASQRTAGVGTSRRRDGTRPLFTVAYSIQGRLRGGWGRAGRGVLRRVLHADHRRAAGVGRFPVHTSVCEHGRPVVAFAASRDAREGVVYGVTPRVVERAGSNGHSSRSASGGSTLFGFMPI